MFSDNISNDLHYLLKTYFLVNFVDLINSKIFVFIRYYKCVFV
jgi:hypothetical protein